MVQITVYGRIHNGLRVERQKPIREIGHTVTSLREGTTFLLITELEVRFREILSEATARQLREPSTVYEFDVATLASCVDRRHNI